MDRPLATQIILGLAATMFTTGCALGAIGMHPSVQNPGLSRLGILLAVSSQPLWMMVVSWRAQHRINGRVRDERLTGYQMCLDQMADDPDFFRQFIARIPRQGGRSSRARRRGL